MAAVREVESLGHTVRARHEYGQAIPSVGRSTDAIISLSSQNGSFSCCDELGPSMHDGHLLLTSLTCSWKCRMSCHF